MFADHATGQGRADGIRAKSLAVGLQGLGTGLEAAVRQRNIGRDDDIADSGPFGDPVIGNVGSGIDDDLFDIGCASGVDPAVGDHEHLERVSVGNPIDLVLHRTGVSIDEDSGTRHGKGLYSPPPPQGRGG